MSNWTHVLGALRIDDIRGLTDMSAETIRAIMGKELQYDDPKEKWDDACDHPEEYLPIGSEGSLHLEVWENPDVHKMTAYTVTVFGDLRDHDSAEEIIDWFMEKVAKISEASFGVRSAFITVENERNGAKNWTYSRLTKGKEEKHG